MNRTDDIDTMEYTAEDAETARAIAIHRGLDVRVEHRESCGYVAVMPLDDFLTLMWFVDVLRYESEFPGPR